MPRRRVADEREVIELRPGRDALDLDRDAFGDRRFAVTVRHEEHAHHGTCSSGRSAKSVSAKRPRSGSYENSLRDTKRPYGPACTTGTPLTRSGSARVS